MGKIFLFFFVFSLFVAGNIISQNNVSNTNEHLCLKNSQVSDDLQQSIDKFIEQAIRNGQANILSKYFFDTIELTIPGSQDSYSKSHAEQLLKRFFQKNPPESFVLNSESTCKNTTTKFFIGTYTSKNEQSFRTYYQIKVINDKEYITVLKFE